MSELDLETVVRQLVTAAAANHCDGALGMTTVRSTQHPVLALRPREVGGRLQELGVGYEIGTLHMGGGVYGSVANDRRAQEALQRNWSGVHLPQRHRGTERAGNREPGTGNREGGTGSGERRPLAGTEDRERGR